MGKTSTNYQALSHTKQNHHIVLSSEEALNMAKEIKNVWSRRKVGITEFKLALAKPQMSTYDLVEALTLTLDQATDNEAKDFYALCDRPLRAELLIPDKELNVALFSKLELGCHEISRAFLTKKQLPRPRSSAYTIHYMEFFTDEVYSELAYMLKDLRKPEIRRTLEDMGPKVLYLIAASEIDDIIYENNESARELFCSLDLGDMIPLEFEFLNLLQDMAPDMFSRVIKELNNQDWVDFRSMFYELQNRNKRLLNHFLEKEKDEGGLTYLDQKLGED